MTKKTALVIAFNILSDELDNMERDYGVEEAREDPYYQDVEEAMTVIAQMIHNM